MTTNTPPPPAGSAADQSAHAIREVLDAVQEERAAARRRLTDLGVERSRLLLTATTAAIAKVEAAIRDAATDLEQLGAIEGALFPMLAAAETKEADAAHAQEIDQAREAITRFNHWLATEYAPHAAAIAAGIPWNGGRLPSARGYPACERAPCLRACSRWPWRMWEPIAAGLGFWCASRRPNPERYRRHGRAEHRV